MRPLNDNLRIAQYVRAQVTAVGDLPECLTFIHLQGTGLLTFVWKSARACMCVCARPGRGGGGGGQRSLARISMYTYACCTHCLPERVRALVCAPVCA